MRLEFQGFCQVFPSEKVNPIAGICFDWPLTASNTKGIKTRDTLVITALQMILVSYDCTFFYYLRGLWSVSFFRASNERSQRILLRLNFVAGSLGIRIQRITKRLWLPRETWRTAESSLIGAIAIHHSSVHHVTKSAGVWQRYWIAAAARAGRTCS